MRHLSVKPKKTNHHIDAWATAFMAVIVIAALVFWAAAH
jgi:hypothetical protein